MQPIEKLENGNILLRVNFTIARHGGRKKIVEEGKAGEDENRDGKILRMIALAHRWQSLLDRGVYADAAEIAKVLKVHQSYTARIIRLNYLHPKIVRLFLEGRAPEGLSLSLLTKTIPDDWNQQLELFGIED